MRVALTGLGCIPFTPRTTFETRVIDSKARSKTAPQAWAVPHGEWNYGQLAAAIAEKKRLPTAQSLNGASNLLNFNLTSFIGNLFR